MKAVKDHLAAALKTPKGTSLMDVRRQLNTDMVALSAADKETLDGFATVRAMIKDKHLPDVILQRELAAEKHYNIEMGALKQGLTDIVAENDDAKVQARSKDVLDHLSQFQDERKAQKFDPKNLPNRSLKPDLTRKPHLTKKAFAEAGFVSNPRLMVATTAPNFDYSQLPGANDPAYLAATTEVTLTPAIKAQAAALNYNPVQIYNWVRNNVQWQPTWGAVQDADLTLSAQRGNAFDISSLLIALLRASNIPARYVHGTINVPEAKFRNWVGGFQDINAAVNYASAGGIPITSLVSGGKITTIQMEHIWVEAAIDFIPSGGAVNKSADSWVPMDASYKQYTIEPGLDPFTVSGLNAQALASSYFSSEPSSTGDVITSINQNFYQAVDQQISQPLQNYITQNLPKATMGDLVGGLVIQTTANSSLSASLPYSITTVGARYGTLPSQLEQSITFSLGVDANGDPLNPVTLPWAELNNNQIILSFLPSSPTDQEALQAMLPSGSINDFSQLPSALSAYLVNVTPQLEVDGTVVASGNAMPLGQELTFLFTPNFAGRNSVPNQYNVVAGSYLDIAAVAGNVAGNRLSSVGQEVTQTGSILATGSQSEINGLTRERILGDVFQAGMLGYYAQYIGLSYVSGLRQGGHNYLAGGIGTFGYEPHVNYSFGIPRTIDRGGLVMNVPIINIFGQDGGGQPARTTFALETGMLSSMLEAAVPQQLLGLSQDSGSAVSAVSAINIASASGQTVYHLTPANQNILLPLIHHNSAVMQEIGDALAGGKDVITHTDDISAGTWTGAGYIIYDPQTGDGAYKISGGQNGDWLYYAGAMAILIIGLSGALIGIGALLFTGFVAIKLMKDLVARWDNYTSQTGVLTPQTRADAELYVGELGLQALSSTVIANQVGNAAAEFDVWAARAWGAVLAAYYWVLHKATP